jgi:hypothetical protein
VIPEQLRPFFWDVSSESFDPAAYPDYSSARILEYGDQDEMAWLKGLFPEAEIKRVLRTEARLSRRSARKEIRPGGWIPGPKLPLLG